MTKSEQIMQLYVQGLSTREIAEKVGCHPSYVRIVARQRKGSGVSENDRRYRLSERGTLKNREKSRRHYWKKKAEVGCRDEAAS